MYACCTATYRQAHDASSLTGLAGIPVTDYELVRCENINAVVTDVQFRVQIDGQWRDSRVRMIRESGPYKTDRYAALAVNPISISIPRP